MLAVVARTVAGFPASISEHVYDVGSGKSVDSATLNPTSAGPAGTATVWVENVSVKGPVEKTIPDADVALKVGADAPEGPVAPACPAAPGEPCVPWGPAAPVLPVLPVKPRAPEGPVAPACPAAPGEPCAPWGPVAPVAAVPLVDPVSAVSLAGFVLLEASDATTHDAPDDSTTATTTVAAARTIELRATI